MGCYFTPHLVSNPACAVDPQLGILSLVEHVFCDWTPHPLACYPKFPRSNCLHPKMQYTEMSQTITPRPDGVNSHPAHPRPLIPWSVGSILSGKACARMISSLVILRGAHDPLSITLIPSKSTTPCPLTTQALDGVSLTAPAYHRTHPCSQTLLQSETPTSWHGTQAVRLS